MHAAQLITRLESAESTLLSIAVTNIDIFLLLVKGVQQVQLVFLYVFQQNAILHKENTATHLERCFCSVFFYQPVLAECAVIGNYRSVVICLGNQKDSTHASRQRAEAGCEYRFLLKIHRTTSSR